jgi:hypothetical protein
MVSVSLVEGSTKGYTIYVDHPLLVIGAVLVGVAFIVYFAVRAVAKKAAKAGASAGAEEALTNLATQQSVQNVAAQLTALGPVVSAVDSRLRGVIQHARRIEKADIRSAVLLMSVGAVFGIVGSFFGPWVLGGGPFEDPSAFVRGSVVFAVATVLLLPTGHVIAKRLDKIYGGAVDTEGSGT